MKTAFAASSDGIHIHYGVSEGAATALLPLVFIPGMLGILDFYQRELSEFGPRLSVAFSHRGLGQSGRLSNGQASFSSRCNDVEAVVSALKLKEYALCGFSRGVAISVEQALRHPEAVKALILIDCDASYMKPTPGWLDHFRISRHPEFHMETLQRYQEEAEQVDLNQRLKDIKCPILILRGAQSGSLLSENNAAVMSKLANGAEIVVLPNTDHEIASEDFELYRHSVLDFLNRI